MTFKITVHPIRSQSAHIGPVFSMYYDNEFLFTGGKDGYLRQWGANMSLIKETQVRVVYN